MQRKLMKELHILLDRCAKNARHQEVCWGLLEVVGELDDVCNDEQEYMYVGTLIDRIKAWLENCN